MKNKIKGPSVYVQAMMNVALKQAYEEGFEAGKSSTSTSVDESTAQRLVNHLDTNAVDFYKDIKPKSANQQRHETIQRAREFVEKQKKERGRDMVYITNCPIGYWCNAEFIVNTDKRTVVALLKWVGLEGSSNKARGIAKCMPGDVFNADICKAIALARALEIEVPSEFQNAVQPDEKVVGMVVFNKSSNKPRPTTIVCSNKFAVYGECHADSIYGMQSTILDDTNAIYTDGECG